MLEQARALLPASIRDMIDELCGISRALRKDLELAFYGSKDLTHVGVLPACRPRDGALA